MRRAKIFIILLLVLACGTVAQCTDVYAAPASGSDAPVSSSDAGYFDRISVVPINVEIPYFYQQVTNVAGMYIFTLPDGTVCKRIYGALGGVYGWYIPEGSDNSVSVNAKPIDTQDDIIFYEEQWKTEAKEPTYNHQGYSGILPPEQSTYGMDSLFGFPVKKIIIFSAVAVLLLCLCISAGAAVHRSRNKKIRNQKTR